jgi:hypothetical protein
MLGLSREGDRAMSKALLLLPDGTSWPWKGWVKELRLSLLRGRIPKVDDVILICEVLLEAMTEGEAMEERIGRREAVEEELKDLNTELKNELDHLRTELVDRNREVEALRSRLVELKKQDAGTRLASLEKRLLDAGYRIDG